MYIPQISLDKKLQQQADVELNQKEKPLASDQGTIFFTPEENWDFGWNHDNAAEETEDMNNNETNQVCEAPSHDETLEDVNETDNSDQEQETETINDDDTADLDADTEPAVPYDDIDVNVDEDDVESQKVNPEQSVEIPKISMKRKPCPKVHTCSECGKTFRYPKSLDRHLCKHFCNEITGLYKDETKVKAIPKPGEDFECKLCDNTVLAKRADEFVAHIGIQHGFLDKVLRQLPVQQAKRAK